MSNILLSFENQQLEKLKQKSKIDQFSYGDTVKVNVIISEGANERVQAFEGVCIRKKNRGVKSSFTVRKISNGEGVERTFPLYSPKIESIKTLKRGIVRRAKLYYMRSRRGKAARITEKKFVAPAKVSKASS